MEDYSAIKKGEIMPLAARGIYLEIVISNGVSQAEKEKYHMTFFICATYKEMIQMNIPTKQKDSQT